MYSNTIFFSIDIHSYTNTPKYDIRIYICKYEYPVPEKSKGKYRAREEEDRVIGQKIHWCVGKINK